MKMSKPPKSRNPFVQHLINRKGDGPHGKSKKSLRRQSKVEVKKFVDSEKSS